MCSPPAVIALSTAFNILLVWSAIMGSGLAITTYFNISSQQLGDFIESPVTLYTFFIDCIVETIFDIKFYATELAGLLFEVQGNSPREVNLAHASQYLSKFSFMSKSQLPENNPEEDNLVASGLMLT
jgi:hypothetical protein